MQAPSALLLRPAPSSFQCSQAACEALPYYLAHYPHEGEAPLLLNAWTARLCSSSAQPLQTPASVSSSLSSNGDSTVNNYRQGKAASAAATETTAVVLVYKYGSVAVAFSCGV